MNGKHIKQHLNKKMEDWLASIDNGEVKKAIKNNVIITGGALVSLLTGDEVKDYDVYFKTKEALKTVAKYYVDYWNENDTEKTASITEDDEGRVRIFISSAGVAGDNSDDVDDGGEGFAEISETEPKEKRKGKYRPKFITSNAITLTDKIQIVVRFYGEVEELHKNYDYVHCTCSWSFHNNELILPSRALEAIINKELYYMGSKYPLCSIFRARKYINRGYTINAGQYLKMAMQLNELDLKDINVLQDQLIGVDSAYFMSLIDAINVQKEKNENFEIDSGYVIELVNRIF